MVIVVDTFVTDALVSCGSRRTAPELSAQVVVFQRRWFCCCVCAAPSAPVPIAKWWDSQSSQYTRDVRSATGKAGSLSHHLRWRHAGGGGGRTHKVKQVLSGRTGSAPNARSRCGVGRPAGGVGSASTSTSTYRNHHDHHHHHRRWRCGFAIDDDDNDDTPVRRRYCCWWW